jgi:hypothetical protein
VFLSFVGEYTGVCHMQNNQIPQVVNYEKIGLYISGCLLFMTIMLFLYQLKDDLSLLKERTRAAEVKIEKLEEK